MNTETTLQEIDREITEQAMTYAEFNELVEQRFSEGRTTDDNNTESMLNYTKMGIQRTGRWNKRAVINHELKEELQDFPYAMTWLVLTEGWCGDGAQNLPFIQKMADASDHIEMRILLREEHPELMDRFLTNGARSIPKLIAINNESGEVVGEWGPRPGIAQKSYMEARANPDIENAKASADLHLWYARDKGKTIQQEFLQLVREWK